MTDLSRPARELLNALHEHARSQKKWDGTRKTSVSLPDLRRVFRTVPHPKVEDELESVVLSRHLDELYECGAIMAMKGDDGEKFPLPRGVWVLPTHQAAKKVREPLPPLHPKMRTVAGYWDNAAPRTRIGYRAVNNWFLSEPDMNPAPKRERALDIFGSRTYSGWFDAEEKAFDELGGPFFSDREAMYKLLQMYSAPPQILTERLIAESDGYYGRIGDGDILLVVENVTTCWSLIEALDEMKDHAVGYVACGMGSSFLASLAGVKMLRRGKIAEIRYFGDLDPTGLSIPAAAAEEAAKDNDLPTVLPAVGLYDALFGVGTPLRRKERRLTAQQATDRVRWLDPSHQAQATTLLCGEDRLAQEWVNLRYLKSNSEWLRDMYR
ncbi:hypothetical protein IM697_38520 [Streptomyces ferrugineus]|uniref:Wadjet protein JetD C-terminal domain-containing protein n=1 Tax=Streptomyces ferrugineus TaxID=1413221 RepID=A0A7M2SJG3_9ACTN|nr:hypothetical protein [Streptomyces ferrugineus]QOV35875.1 hypothetical protein IM697_38520 [Streptomyces ferrugineus]